METYINVGNFIELTEDSSPIVLQNKIDTIAKYYGVKGFDTVDAYMVGNQDVDIVIRVSSELSYLEYSSKDFYESSAWKPAVNIISYNEWLHTRPSQDSSESEKEPHHYIYLLKSNLSFALMTMSGDVSYDYITLLDYSDIGEVNTYTASSFLNLVSSAFDMDKFHQIPVKNSDRATINDVFDFLKKEK